MLLYEMMQIKIFDSALPGIKTQDDVEKKWRSMKRNGTGLEKWREGSPRLQLK